jgi:hypothetical protein
MSSLVEKYYLDSKIADEIENWVLRDDNSIKWQFNSNVAYDYKSRQKQIEEYGHEFNFKDCFCPGFSSRFIHQGNKRSAFWHKNCMQNLKMNEIKKILGSEYHLLNIWRMQLWMYPAVGKEYFNQPHNPHIDLSTRRGRANGIKISKDETGEGNIVMLYYVSDSDGDNYFYKIKDECSDHPSLDNDEMFHPDLLEVVQQETPKKGTLLVMDGDVIHSSSSPSKGIRTTLNINLLPKQL